MKSARPASSQPLWRKLVASTCIAALLSSCASTPPDMSKIDPAMPKPFSALNVLQEEPVVTLETEPNEFWTVEYDRGDPLPHTLVGPVSVNNVSVADLVEMVAKSLNIGIVKDGEISERTISYNDPRRRHLQDVLDTITRKTGLFYEYRDGLISFDTKRRFFVRVPRIELIESIEGTDRRGSRDRTRDRNRTRTSSLGSRDGSERESVGNLSDDRGRITLTESSIVMISEAFENLGAAEVFVDQISGTVTFTADYRTYRMAQKFMQSFETGRDMLIYDVWVFERTLRKGVAAGLYWDKLQGRINGTTIGTINEGAKAGNDTLRIGPAANPGGFQFGIISNPSQLVLNVLFSLLDEDADSEIVARPTITLMSGGMSQFHVGETREYIAQVEGTTTGAVTASTTQSVETDILETGILLKLKGAHSDGLINTLVDLNMIDLIEFREFSTGGTGRTEDGADGDTDADPDTGGGTGGPTPAQNADLNRGTTLLLPHTSNRSIKTVFDARPGDLILLGGLIRGKKENRNRNLYKTNLALGQASVEEKVETIMLMRPRLVKIRPKGTVVPIRNEINVPPGVSKGTAETGPLILRGDPQGARPFPPKPDAGIFDLDPNSIMPRPAPAKKAAPTPEPVKKAEPAVAPPPPPRPSVNDPAFGDALGTPMSLTPAGEGNQGKESKPAPTATPDPAGATATKAGPNPSKKESE